MTGYASAQSQLGTGSSAAPPLRFVVDIRSVNSRFLDLSFRLPEELRQLEPGLRELIAKQIKRGKVEVRVQLESDLPSNTAAPDTQVLKNLVNIQNQVRMWLPEAGLLSVADVIRMGSYTQVSLPQETNAAVMSLAQTAVSQLCEARHREALKLAEDLLKRVGLLRSLADQALPLVPQAVALQKQKFLERWREALALAEANALPDSVQERALAEAASFAVRADVAEEITRLKTHLDEITRLLSQSTQPEGVGKRLDFLIQELHREANTLGSKSSAIELTRISLDMKVLIEQMREQVQNLE